MAAITSAVIGVLSFIMSVITYVDNQYQKHPYEKKTSSRVEKRHWVEEIEIQKE